MFKVVCFAYFLGAISSGSGDILFSELHFPVGFSGLGDGPWVNYFSFSSKTFVIELLFSFSSLFLIINGSEENHYIPLSRN